MAKHENPSGRAFLYVLATSGPEDLLKVGLTRDPLARWSSFHPRWFEVFDLDHSLLVETETRGDAQVLETALHRFLVDHQCPIPMTMRLAAGGATEWYRGAYQTALAFVIEHEQAGYSTHLHARSWLEPRMLAAREQLAGLLHQAFEDQCSGWLSMAQLQSIRNLVDAHRAFGADVDSLASVHVLHELGLRGSAV